MSHIENIRRKLEQEKEQRERLRKQAPLDRQREAHVLSRTKEDAREQLDLVYATSNALSLFQNLNTELFRGSARVTESGLSYLGAVHYGSGGGWTEGNRSVTPTTVPARFTRGVVLDSAKNPNTTLSLLFESEVIENKKDKVDCKLEGRYYSGKRRFHRASHGNYHDLGDKTAEFTFMVVQQGLTSFSGGVSEHRVNINDLPDFLEDHCSHAIYNATRREF